MKQSLSVVGLLGLTACALKAPPAVESPSVDVQPVDASDVIVNELSALNFSKLGDPVLHWDSIPSPRASKESPHKLLVIPVEFSDYQFDRFSGDPEQAEKIQAHYQDQMFDPEYERLDTLSHYYAAQSDDMYHLDGLVLKPVKLTEPLSTYGRPTKPKGGDWRNDGEMEIMINDALTLAKAANPELDWASYDQWDPKDYDDDGVNTEPDGYIDHLVMIYAGNGQSSCQLLRGLNTTLNPNVDTSVLDSLTEAELACADRIWPHRSSIARNEGHGPQIAGIDNQLGGLPVVDGIWAYDYNMQSEYTASSTFIHEFGHSIGLPDIYSRTSSNSTGLWEVMSSTSSPSPQNMSSWSRLMLGWDAPLVIKPPAYGGEQSVTFYLSDATFNQEGAAESLTRSAMIVLPPKEENIDLGSLPETSGQLALYSGKGNDLNRTATLSVDLSKVTDPVLSFDAFWQIEGGWDFAYVERQNEDGSWTRQLPIDGVHMPAEQGHDGPESLPGLTGRSGDMDGDGKNESNPACDPTAEIKSGEDKDATQVDPCEQSNWVHLAFNLEGLETDVIKVRIRYFTDGAAVENGILIDNLTVPGLIAEDFEGGVSDLIELDGWVQSPGHHEIKVPHYMLLEFRDPNLDDPKNYDHNLAKGAWSIYQNPNTGDMNAAHFKANAGMIAWYFNGAYAWSENDPALNGVGLGYLLALDANPNEFKIPGYSEYLLGNADAYDTHYDISSDEAQEKLKHGYYSTACFVRDNGYMLANIDDEAFNKACPSGVTSSVKEIEIDGKKAIYSYELTDLLPGAARDPYRGVGEILDIRHRKGEFSYRLRDRTLRYYHTMDAPFSYQATENSVVFYTIKDGNLVTESATTSEPISTFSAADLSRWQNPNLPFGGVTLPSDLALSWTVEEPGADAPAGARSKVTVSWE